MSDSPTPNFASEWDAELENRMTVEKVLDVVLQLGDPERVSVIAERAGVAPDTARKYLQFLTETGIARMVSDDPAMYDRNDEYLMWRRIDRLRNEYSVEELEQRLSALGEQIATFEQTYQKQTPAAVDPTEYGYDALDKTVQELRHWGEALDEVENILDALGRKTQNRGHESESLYHLFRLLQFHGDKLSSGTVSSNQVSIESLQNLLTGEFATKASPTSSQWSSLSGANQSLTAFLSSDRNQQNSLE